MSMLLGPSGSKPAAKAVKIAGPGKTQMPPGNPNPSPANQKVAAVAVGSGDKK
jgi:hypothetical protein